MIIHESFCLFGKVSMTRDKTSVKSAVNSLAVTD